jgi:hypothetical protein
MINWGYKEKPKLVIATIMEIGIYVRDFDNGNELMHWHGKTYHKLFNLKPGDKITLDMVRGKMEDSKKSADEECIEYCKQVGCDYLGCEFVDCRDESKRFDTIYKFIDYMEQKTKC